MSMLRDFQSKFMEHLLASQLPVMPAATYAALSVYRNTIMKGWIDGLAANYPTVKTLVGDEWFDAAASEYARQIPPDSPVLALYGQEFPAFLEEFPPAFDLSYLSEVANIDRLWIESYFAPDAPVLNASILKELSGEQLMSAQLKLHPATKICACKHSAVSIWFHTRDSSSNELITDDSDEFLLIARSSNNVVTNKISRIEYEFLRTIETGSSLGEASMKAFSEDPLFPLASLLAQWIKQGVFSVD